MAAFAAAGGAALLAETDFDSDSDSEGDPAPLPAWALVEDRPDVRAWNC